MRKKRILTFVVAAAMAVTSLSLTAFAADSYELYVNGEQFASDKLTIACGDGTAVFDGVDTLTLNNATIDKPSSSPAGSYLYGVINSGIKDLKIVLKGDNVLDVVTQYTDGIDSAGGCNVTIKGSGTLSLNNCYYGTYIGVWDVAGADLTISDGATVTVTDSSAAGLWANHDITFNDCEVTVDRQSENYNGIVSNVGGTITVNNSNVTVSNISSAIHMGNTDNSNHAIVINSGKVKLTSTTEDENYPAIKVEPVKDTDVVNGTLTINGGTLDVTAASKGTNIPESNITLGSGVSYTKGTSLTGSGNVVVSSGPSIKRLSGPSRYTTSVEISKATFSTANTVVLASGEGYADALAGVPFANKLNAPILLVKKDVVSTAVINEIKRLGAKKVIILGGDDTVSDKVKNTIKNSISGLTFERYQGTTRFGTAVEIAKKLNTAPTEVFFVYGYNYADALSVGSVAAAKKAPILYLKTDGDLDSATKAYLASIKKTVKNAYVIGGDDLIPDAMMKKASDALGLKVGTTMKRVSGTTRYNTCVEVNKAFSSVLTGTKLCVATGTDFPDALSGGVYAAKNKAPLFLVNGKVPTLTLSANQKSYLKSKNVFNITIFGGADTVPDAHVQTVANALK